MADEQPVVTLLERAEIANITFGNKVVWTSEPGEFHGDAILTTNEAFTIAQMGLNFYIFPTAKIKVHGPFAKRKMTADEQKKMRELLAVGKGENLAGWYAALKYRRELRALKPSVIIDDEFNEQLDFMQEKIDDWNSDYDPQP